MQAILKSVVLKPMLGAGLIGISMAASAAPIVGLYNTGVDSLGVALATGTADTHYSLVSGVSTTAYAGGVNGVFPIGPWVPNTATVSWLTPGPVAATSFDPSVAGIYTYTLAFNLTGFDATTAFLNFDIGADNAVSVALNGGAPVTATGFSSLTSLGFNSGFVSGINSLVFTVTNFAASSGNPTGLYVLFTRSNADALAVPEPGSLAALGVGLLAFAGAARRRRR
jgi:hypothetical protein